MEEDDTASVTSVAERAVANVRIIASSPIATNSSLENCTATQTDLPSAGIFRDDVTAVQVRTKMTVVRSSAHASFTVVQ